MSSTRSSASRISSARCSLEPPARWITQRLLDRRADLQPRVERLVGVLVDDLHPPPQRPQGLVRERRDVPAVEGDRPCTRVDQAKHASARSSSSRSPTRRRARAARPRSSEKLIASTARTTLLRLPRRSSRRSRARPGSGRRGPRPRAAFPFALMPPRPGRRSDGRPRLVPPSSPRRSGRSVQARERAVAARRGTDSRAARGRDAAASPGSRPGCRHRAGQASPRTAAACTGAAARGRATSDRAALDDLARVHDRRPVAELRRPRAGRA